jgi:hypothetical protein
MNCPFLNSNQQKCTRKTNDKYNHLMPCTYPNPLDCPIIKESPHIYKLMTKQPKPTRLSPSLILNGFRRMMK